MEREPGQIPNQGFHIEGATPRESFRERLFEAIFRYPQWIAEQVIEMEELSPDLDKDFINYHTSNIGEMDEIMERLNLARKEHEGTPGSTIPVRGGE